MNKLLTVLLIVPFIAACGAISSIHRVDVAKVISIKAPETGCGILPATMIYEDSQGVQHTLDYQMWGTDCPGD